MSFQVDLELSRNVSGGFDAGGVPSFMIHVAHFRTSFCACLHRAFAREVSLHRNLGKSFDRLVESFFLGIADRLKLHRGPILDDRLSTLVAFETRRARLTPLVFQSYNWQHGVFVAAAMGSETTAAATGEVGIVRRDPMAMLPFCGYNMADYWGHWLTVGQRASRPPAIFHVNWFRTDSGDGRFLWPGFGENLRVLLWILERTAGRGKAEETPIGWVPRTDAINLDGLDVASQTMKKLLCLDNEGWRKEVAGYRILFRKVWRSLAPGAGRGVGEFEEAVGIGLPSRSSLVR